MNPKDRELLEMARDALKGAEEFIEALAHDLHSERIADWYREGAHNAANAMNESMRLLGNHCAGFDMPALAAIEERLRAKSKAEELAERGFVKPPYPTAADDFGERLQADEKEEPLAIPDLQKLTTAEIMASALEQDNDKLREGYALLIEQHERLVRSLEKEAPVAYLYHDGTSPHELNPLVHSTLLVLASDRREGNRNETPLYAHGRKGNG